VSLEEHILVELKEGVALKDVYESTIAKTKKERPDLVEKLTKNFGFSMGIEFRDAPISITPNCNVKVKKGEDYLVQGVSEFREDDRGVSSKKRDPLPFRLRPY
jgi:nucleosome binding factor SPN SPT16 subunit